MEAAREQDQREDGASVAFLLAWSLAGLCVALFVANVPLYLLARSARVPSSWAEKSLEGFGARLMDETNLDSLSEDLVGVVGAAVHPAQVSLWLRPSCRTGTHEESCPRREARCSPVCGDQMVETVV
jgi:hypothetical protein